MAMIQLSRVALEYLPHGNGPERILFTHGFLSSGRIWRLVQEALPADRYTTIAVCNRGAGASDAPPEVSDFGVEVFASDLHELVTQDIANAPERRLLGSLLSVFAQRMGDQLDRLKMPVLFVGGDIDRMITPATQLASWAKYPAAGLHMFHGVGHSPNLDRPKELAALLRQFIEETIPARGRVLEQA
jgi:pimeloyl-ACP methyl ester carboxylesterase